MLKLLHALSLYLSFFMDGADRGKISGCKCHTPSFSGRQITVTVYEWCKILGQKKFLAIRYGRLSLTNRENVQRNDDFQNCRHRFDEANPLAVFLT